MMGVTHKTSALSTTLRPAVRLAGRALLGILAYGAALAQESGQTADPEYARYEVELIVFRHLDSRGSTPEVARPAVPVTQGASAAALPGLLATTGEDLWSAITAPELKLGSVAARLRRGGAYELLYHGGWIQQVEPQARARPVPLPAEAARNGTGGVVRLYRERYLHAQVDIGLLDTKGSPDDVRWIRQSRRLRGTALQYFDNPAIGVILTARPADQRPDPQRP